METKCTRCKGKGYGGWAVQNGICWGCNGKGTRAAQIAVRDAADRRVAAIAAIEDITIVVDATTRREATRAYIDAFAITAGILPFFQEFEPGTFAAVVRWNLADTLEYLGS